MNMDAIERILRKSEAFISIKRTKRGVLEQTPKPRNVQ